MLAIAVREFPQRRGVMHGAGAGDDQQSRVVTAEHRGDPLPGPGDELSLGGIDRQLAAQHPGRGQRLGLSNADIGDVAAHSRSF